MKALKLKLAPTKEQYDILDEMFNKWASICNRYNKYTYQNNMKEEEIKEKLKPKQNVQTIQFSQTQTNQQAKKDNSDLIRAMGELKKQKERELASLEERRDTINSALTSEKDSDIDPQKSTRLRPKGWRNFKTRHHWESELEKLERQIKNKRETIKKIDKKKIYFKPKRIGLWSSSFKISFQSETSSLGKIILEPLYENRIELYVITEPLQIHKGSSLTSKKFMHTSIKDFIVFALHKELFGLSNSEDPVIKRKVNPFVIFDYSNEKNKQKEELKEKFKDARIKLFEKWLSIISDQEKFIIREEIDKFWDKTRDELNNSKKKKLQSVFTGKYIDIISKSKKNVENLQRDIFNQKISSFNNDKLPKWKKDYTSVLTEDDIKLLISEINKAFEGSAQEFSSYKYCDEYIRILNKVAEFQFNRKEPYKINKYPILFRKPITKRKNIKNLKPGEWKYYIQFAYDQINAPSIKTTNILGIDRGLTHLLAYSIFDTSQSKFIVNKLVQNPAVGWKWKLRKMKRSIQHLERETRAQKNVHIFENQMKKRFRSIENKIEDLYHNESRRIVNIAKDKNASIVFENLEQQGLKQHGRKKNARMKKLNYTLSLFDYGKIASLIFYKAKNEGISVYDVEPAYTSQNCAKCVLENKKFVDGINICYWEDFNVGNNIPSSILEGTQIENAKIKKINMKEIQVEGNANGSKDAKFIIKKGNSKITLIDEDKEVVAEFQTRVEGEKTAIIDYVYKRGIEIIEKRPKYTGNKKVGFCTKHGQIDADLNAARVIALCKHFNINNPVDFGTRNVFK